MVDQVARKSSPVPKAGPVPRSWYKCFAIDTSVDVMDIGEVPGGHRFHISYQKTSVTPMDDRCETVHVLSGTDWVLQREDGIAVFDALLTFHAEGRSVSGSPFSFIFDCMMSGRAAAPEGFKEIAVALPVQFEAGQLSDAWIAEKYKVPDDVFAIFRPLIQNQCLAVGKITVGPEKAKWGVSLNFLVLDPTALEQHH